MATTPGSRRRETRTDITGDDRDTLTPMQEPLGSMDNPGSRTSNINEVNLPPGETVRRTGNLGTTNGASSSTTGTRGRSLTTTFAIAAVVLIAAFLFALFLNNNRSDLATNSGTPAPVADSDTVPNTDTTGSTTTPPPQSTPGAGDTGTGTTTPPANP